MRILKKLMLACLILFYVMLSHGCESDDGNDGEATADQLESDSTSDADTTTSPDTEDGAIADQLESDSISDADTVIPPDTEDTTDIEQDVSVDHPEIDEKVEALLSDYSVPGASIAVAYNGQLVYAKAYGLADIEQDLATTTAHRFRIASISKPITAVAVMTLVEDGAIDLDTPAFTYLSETVTGEPADTRLADVTVRDLMRHSSGIHFPDYPTGDPYTETPEGIAEVMTTLNLTEPPTADDLVRFTYGHIMLDTVPGIRMRYSNLNYVILSQIIEAITEQPFEAWVRAEVLAPMGITSMAIGSSRPGEALPDEVTYYDAPNSLMVNSVFDGAEVPWPYGGWNLEAMVGAGAWVATPVDLVRFMLSIDGDDDYPDTINTSTVDTMRERPPWFTDDQWYGLGLFVGEEPDGGLWWSHNGGLQGTTAYMYSTSQDHRAVIILNGSADYPENTVSAVSFHRDIEAVLDSILTTEYPEEDLFPDFE